jgi:hypothetical protein
MSYASLDSVPGRQQNVLWKLDEHLLKEGRRATDDNARAAFCPTSRPSPSFSVSLRVEIAFCVALSRIVHISLAFRLACRVLHP